MTWTPPEDERTRQDIVRAMVGDTDQDDPQIEDEDLAYYLAKEPDSDERAAWRVCIFLIGKYARLAASQVGPLKEESQERIENYSLLASAYFSVANGGSGVGGDSTETALGRLRGARARYGSEGYRAFSRWGNGA